MGDPNTCLLKYNPSNNSWKNIPVPKILNGLFAVHVTSNNTILVGTEGSGLLRSTNQGADWTKVLVYPSRITSFLSDKNGIIYTGTIPRPGGDVMYSEDDGLTWKVKGTGLSNEFVLAIALSDDGTFYAATARGVYTSNIKDGLWTITRLSGFECYSVTVLSSGRVIVGSFAGDIYYSDDKGSTWTKSILDNKTKWIHNFTVDNYNNLYAATGVVESNLRLGGLFRSIDNGNTWQQIAFKDSLVLAVKHLSSNKLLLGTYKTIYFSSDVSKMKYDNDDIEFINYPNPFSKLTTFKIISKFGSPVSLEIYDILGRLMYEYKTNPFTIKGEHSITWNASNVASGLYIVRVSTGYEHSIKKIALIK